MPVASTHSVNLTMRHVAGLFTAKPRAPAARFTHEGYDEARQIAFTFSIIALSAKLAQVNGHVTKQSYWAFREVFPMQASEDTKIRSLFLAAMNEKTGPDHYVRQILRLFPNRPALYLEILHRLFKIASADMVLSKTANAYLRQLAKGFGLSARQFRKLTQHYNKPVMQTPYQILAVNERVSDAELKQVHRRLVNQYHPDKCAANGASDEMLTLLSNKMAHINAAYDEIIRLRHKKSARVFIS